MSPEHTVEQDLLEALVLIRAETQSFSGMSDFCRAKARAAIVKGEAKGGA